MIEARQQPDVIGGKSRPPAVDGVVHLASQIFVVLPGDLRNRVIGITLPGGAVTGFAESRIDAGPVRDELATAYTGR